MEKALSRQTLFGYVSMLETIVRFHREEFGLSLRGKKSVRVAHFGTWRGKQESNYHLEKGKRKQRYGDRSSTRNAFLCINVLFVVLLRHHPEQKKRSNP